MFSQHTGDLKALANCLIRLPQISDRHWSVNVCSDLSEACAGVQSEAITFVL